ncbi:MAG: ArsR/SmtB family transcription factor, partial [Planctomycetota bacterium]
MTPTQDADGIGEDTCGAFCYNEKVVERLRTALPGEEKLDEMAEFFSALGNRTRLLVLTCLCEADELCVCDIANTLDMNL